MSEVQSRPAASRGRGAGRGGRGGHARGGSRQQARSPTNGDSKAFDSLDSVEDEGEIGQLKKLYGAKSVLIKEMFPDWSDVDLLFALQETDGDENLAVTRIAEGTISQWGEVSKPKKERSKPKDPSKPKTFTTTTGDTYPNANARPARGGRTDSGRGRGRATERGGRAPRGRSAVTNGTHSDKIQPLSQPTEESSAWDAVKPDGDATAWGTAANETPAAAPAPVAKPVAPAEPPAKTWASMLRQSTAKPAPPPKPKEVPAPKPAEVIEPLPPAVEPVVVEEQEEPEVKPAPAELPAEPVKEAPIPEIPTVVTEVALPPSQDQLTETNLEQVADISHPPETETARSEAADSWDPRAAALSATATPLSASHQQHQAARAATSGHAATAIRATERAATRTPSYGRRLLDQEEAVRMPGNREVERNTVQFGALNLNFSGVDDDIDGDREEPETRAQPPADSPIAHPRTSLPVVQPAAIPDAFATQKPAASPIPPTAPAAATAVQPPTQPAAMAQAAQQQPPTQPSQPHQGFGRFGPISNQDQQQSFGQKPYDAFGQQTGGAAPPAAQHQHQYDGFQSHPQSQAHSQAPVSAPAPAPALSSAPNDFSPYYSADPQNRGSYGNYYNYGQQQQASQQQDGPLQSQRTLGGYNASQNQDLSQYPQSGVQAPASSRFGAGSAIDAQNSGNTTPNPPGQAQQQAGQGAQSHLQQQQQQQQQQHANQHGFNHPYLGNPYYSTYGGHYQSYGQGGYGAPYGKGGVYGQPTGYQMMPQGPYDYASTGGSGFGQSSLSRGDSGLGSGLGDYGRTSAQSASQQGLGGSGYGGMHDGGFGRGASAYQSQAAGQGFGGSGSQPGAPAGNDDLKPFSDGKGAGPSPSMSGARPISAANNAQAGSQQGGLPPPQQGGVGQQGIGGGYGSYPNHLQGAGIGGHGGLHGVGSVGGQSGSGGSYGMGGGAVGGGAGGAAGQTHANNPYGGAGGYGNQGFGGAANFYGNQQARGWGNNYH